MKKIVTLLLAAGLVFSAANSASALEVKINGAMDFTFEAYQNLENPFQSTKNSAFNNGAANSVHQKYGGAVQRFRLGIDLIASESLRAYYQIQVGTWTWGGGHGRQDAAGHRGVGGQLAGGHAANVTTHLAYLDWMVPNTDVRVRMGYQPVGLPSFTFGAPILSNRGSGITVNIPVNQNITVTPMWVRAASDYQRDANDLGDFSGQKRSDKLDVLALAADFRYDGFRVSPYAGFAAVGKHVGTRPDGFAGNSVRSRWGYLGQATATDIDFGGAPLNRGGFEKRGGSMWFAGISGELTMFDPFRFTADFYYGSMDGKGQRFWIGDTHYNSSVYDRAGWYAMLGAEYRLPQYGVLGLKGWYASGDDSNWANGSERAPAIWGGFNATSTYFDGAYSIGNNVARANIDGSWGIQLSWKNISFIDKLSHDFSVTYVRGTNSEKMVGGRTYVYGNNSYDFAANVNGPVGYLTKKDALIELNLDTTYQIYQNLAAVLELAYIIEDFDGKVWGWDGANNERVKAKFSNMWRAALNFSYKF